MTGPRARLSSPVWWWDRARCAGRDRSAMFFADDGDDRDAKAWCHGCPVRTECLAEGLEEPNGVWGGLNRRQRVRLVRVRKALSEGDSSAEDAEALARLVCAGLDADQAHAVLGLGADEVAERCGVRPGGIDVEVRV